MRFRSADQVMEELAQIGAVIGNSHVVYTSGMHGSTYVNKDAIYPHTHLVRELTQSMALPFRKRSIEVVVGPEKGGIILSQAVAFQLQTWNMSHDIDEVLSAYAEKDGDNFVFRRGYENLIAGRQILIVEDILTTGGSVLKVVKAVRELGGKVAGVSAICNRGSVTTSDVGNVPELLSLVDVKLDAWEERDCPLCARGIPINTQVGKGREFLATRSEQKKS